MFKTFFLGEDCWAAAFQTKYCCNSLVTQISRLTLDIAKRKELQEISFKNAKILYQDEGSEQFHEHCLCP